MSPLEAQAKWIDLYDQLMEKLSGMMANQQAVSNLNKNSNRVDCNVLRALQREIEFFHNECDRIKSEMDKIVKDLDADSE